MSVTRVGDIAVSRIVEIEGPAFEPTWLLPDATDEALAPHREWLEPWALDPATGQLIVTIQSYLLKTRHHTILIDTCVGNDKERRMLKTWNMRSDDGYLAGLAARGVQPEDVDFVMCTHLHVDHVGWNTRLVDGRWVPTFANAKYVFAREEWAYWEEINKGGKKHSDGSIDDSVLPVIEAGQAVLVDSDHVLDDEIRLEPSPGHTPGHVSVRLASNGARAVMSGDVIHHPVQCAHPEWSGMGCVDKELSRRTRRALLERVCESGELLMTAHFPSPSMGRIVPEGGAFRIRYED